MVFGWQIFSETYQEKKRKDWKKLKRRHTTDATETQTFMKLLWTTVCPQPEQPRGNSCIPANVPSSKTESWGIGSLNRPTVSKEPESVRPSKKCKLQVASLVNSNQLSKTNKYYTKIILGHHKERKLQGNIPGNHRCRNPQQNISKPNSTIY